MWPSHKLVLSRLVPVIAAVAHLALAPLATAEIVPAERRTTWNPGLNAVGGIPIRTTIYRTLSPSGGDDTAAIQTALDNCPAGQVVKLNAGNFRISGEGLAINRSYVTLRGSGASTRLLKVDRSSSDYPVVIIGNRWSSGAFVSSTNLAVNGTKGSTSVTLASAPSPALTVGEIVFLDQKTNPNLTWWGPNAPPGSDARGWFSRYDRPVTQIVEVASVSGATVTFTTPLHIDFLTAYAAQLSRHGYSSVLPATKWSGIEDLYLEGGRGGDGGGNIHLFVCAYSWVKNVESAHSIGTSVNLDSCFRCEVRDSYIHTSDNPNPGGGGYLLGVNFGSSDNLIENNVVWNGNKVLVMRASGGGNVIGYNYMEDGYGEDYKSIPEVGLNAAHMTTAHMELFEGNQCWNFATESFWGNAIYITAFRNHLTGLRRSLGGLGLYDTDGRFAVAVDESHWWYSFSGNVLGTQGQTLLPGQSGFVYEDTGIGGQVPMWSIGMFTSPPDALVKTRTLRHGNFDYVSNSVVWDAANADRNLPASLYLTRKPAFFGSLPWPWVDSVGATKTHILPARARRDAGLGTPSITAPAVGQVIGVSGVTFAWTGVQSADRYELYAAKSPSGEVVYSGSILGGASTSVAISLPAGQYQFSVRGCAGGATLCGSFASVVFTVSLIAPAGAPTITAPAANAVFSTSTQTFRWTAVTPNPALSGMTYEVLLRDLAAGTTTLQITVPSPTTSTVFTMRSSSQYELKVRACQAGCGPWSTAVRFAVTLPPVPTGIPSGIVCNVSGGKSLTCSWGGVARADAYRVQVVQPPPAGPGGGALTVAARQVSGTTVTLPVPAGGATVYISACNGDGCGGYGTAGITAGGPNPSQANIGTPMAGTVVSGPGVLFTWNRVPGDNGSNTWYRLFVQDLSRQATALDVFTTSNFYSAYFKAEGARYDALVVSNPGLASQMTGPAQGFNVSGSSATAPTLVSPAHNSTVGSGNIQLGWSPAPGATLYEYFVAVQGQGSATVRGVTPGVLAQVPLTGSAGGTVYNGIARACPAGAVCQPGSDAGWGPWSNVPGGPGVTTFRILP